MPDVVFDSISRHLVRSGHRAEDGFLSNEEDEDRITGDLFRSLRRGWSKPVLSDGTEWKWRLTTRTIRGKGEGATESVVGADGVIQVEVDSGHDSSARKGLLFQAKKKWIYRDGDLIEQINKMESFAPGASAVFDYRPDAYRAVAGTIVLQSDGRPNVQRQRRLGEFLADEFLGCFVGRPDTYYDWDMATLVLAGERPVFANFPIHMNPKFVAALQVRGGRR